MTNREFYTAVSKSNLSADLKAFADEALAKLDARNEKRKNTPSKAQLANEDIKTSIVEAIGSATLIGSEIAALCGISPQKATALCSQLVTAGVLICADRKVKGKGTINEYSVAPTESTDEVVDEVVEG